MEHEGSFPSSQEIATGLYSDTDETNLHSHALVFKIHFSIILLPTSHLRSGLSPSGIPTKISFLIPSMGAICPAHLIHLDLIALIIFDLLSFRLISKSLKIKIYKTVILPFVLYGCETWSLTLGEEHRLKVFENRVLRKIFGPKREEDGSFRKLHNDELHSLYFHRILLG
jgi:hypothetical protein